ncbi:MAG: (d)CMP kinase [Polyangiaceae bacterium]|nr:(d)CMP kinase [Polyangiaceae bacterium]
MKQSAYNARRAPRVAIDGPAGAGKSTVAKRLAERLGFLHVDTGAIYRTVALAAHRAGYAWDDEPNVARVAEALVAERRIAMEKAENGSAMRIVLDGQDVSPFIRTPEMSAGASRVSAIAAVRKALLALQRQAGESGGCVLEGRDIGTVVFPDAEVKLFLTATVAERAKRRFDELVGKGVHTTLDATLTDLVARDKADTERPVAPLKQAEDAILVDSTDRDVDAVIEEMVRVVNARAR